MRKNPPCPSPKGEFGGILACEDMFFEREAESLKNKSGDQARAQSSNKIYYRFCSIAFLRKSTSTDTFTRESKAFYFICIAEKSCQRDHLAGNLQFSS